MIHVRNHFSHFREIMSFTRVVLLESKTAIVMKGKIKERHDTSIYFKSNCAKGCSNSYNLWKFYMISLYFVLKWHQLIQPDPLNRFVHGLYRWKLFQMIVIDHFRQKSRFDLVTYSEKIKCKLNIRNRFCVFKAPRLKSAYFTSNALPWTKLWVLSDWILCKK